MIAALSLAVVLAAGLWPFSSAERDADATIGSLKRNPDIEMRKTVPDSSARARDQYQEFLALPGTPTDMRAESMRRLADLYLAAAEEADLAADSAGSEAQYRSAISLYNQYLSEFPDRSGADKVLYALSRAEEGVGESVLALAFLDRLVRDYPQSAVAAEAQFRRGERLFVNRDYAGAQQAYAAVIARGEQSEFYEQALYKEGWAQFKLGLYQECLQSVPGRAQPAPGQRHRRGRPATPRGAEQAAA